MGARPFTLRCPKCKAHEDYRVGDRRSNRELFRIGNEIVAKRSGRRRNVKMWEIVHDAAGCRRIFWTSHREASTKPLREPRLGTLESILGDYTRGRKPAEVKP